jgi:pimeloyl-ACP methyl ester carboxylesterase
MNKIDFTSRGVRCAAWHLTASADDLTTADGRPCVVMAHGFGGTRDTALLPYAQGFAGAGLDVVLFDYRGFGDSDGEPRQQVSYRRQRDDYRAAVAAARALDGVDPDRIVLWGTSYSGGHVIAVAAQDQRVAGIISLTPATDGLAALVSILRHGGPRQLIRLVVAGVRDLIRAGTRRAPYLIPAAGPAGSLAVLANDVAADAYPAMAGPTWRNEVCGRSVLGVGLNRPVRFASRLRCPMLVQVGDNDAIAPPAAAKAAAKAAGSRAELKSYPVDHFDVYDGHWQEQALADQLAFLRRHLDQVPPRRAAGATSSARLETPSLANTGL